MNPLVNTSFLPDRDREAEERRQREELRQDWLTQQENMKRKSSLVLLAGCLLIHICRGVHQDYL
jgi:hypothetical protein